jgi:hypothetical protein
VRVLECGPDGCTARGRFEGRRFLLPAHAAAKMLLTREQVLAGPSPPPPPIPRPTQAQLNAAVHAALRGEQGIVVPAEEEPPKDEDSR